MRELTRLHSASLACAVALFAVSCGVEPPPSLLEDPAVRIEVGRLFPSLLFPRLGGGEPASVDDYRGKKILLHVFASW